VAESGVGKTVNLRDNGYHVAVSEEGVEQATRIFESLGASSVEYQECPVQQSRTFWSRDSNDPIGAFDLWGNLVIYQTTMGEGNFTITREQLVK